MGPSLTRVNKLVGEGLSEHEIQRRLILLPHTLRGYKSKIRTSNKSDDLIRWLTKRKPHG